MANEEQVAFLKKAKWIPEDAWWDTRQNEWNEWRKKNIEVEIDLSFADLRDVSLWSLNLSNANLSNANLRGADLRGADLRNVNFEGANLKGVNFNSANLSSAKLRDADLSFAEIRNANLSSADLSGANLSNVNLSRIDFISANLSKANLRVANLKSADLRNADLSYADLSHADLSYANLSSASFRAANLKYAKIISARIISANLNTSQVLYTDFTRSTLTGTCIADWQIGRSTILKDVKCDCIFRTYDYGKEEFSGRLPVDPASTFAPSEFIQRFQIIASALETIDITFTEGIDWQAFFQSFQELRASRPNEDISIQGMERKGDAFIVRLEVEAEADKAAIETEVKQHYTHQLAALEARYEERLRLQGAHLEDARCTIELERQRNTEILGVIGIVAQSQGSKYDMRGAQFAGGFAETVQGNQNAGIINNYGQKADDIVRLLTSLRQLSQAFPEDQRADILMELDDLEGDLSKPEKQEPKRIGKRLQRLIAAGTTAATLAGGAATFAGNINDFTANVLELGEKIGLSRDAIQP